MSGISQFDPGRSATDILAAVVESSDDAIIVRDLSGVILTWNRGAERIYGYSAAEMIGQSVSILIPEGQADELSGILSQIRRGDRVEPYETVRRAKDGHLVDVFLTVSPIRDAAGQVVGASAIARDITDRRRSEAALRSSEARWRAIIESAVDGIIVIDARGRIEAFNKAAERLFGYQEADVVGENVKMLMPSPYREEHDGYIARYLATGDARIIGVGREVTAKRRDGGLFPVHLSVGELVVHGERKFTGIVHDLSARVRMEEQLREQASLVRLGEMAAVIAHEVKNPLAGVRGAIQVIGGRLPADSKDAAIAKEIITRIDSLNDLIKDLLLFARPPQPKFAVVDVPPLVSVTAELLKKDPALSAMEIVVSGSAPAIHADAEFLKIAFQNLLVNSAHAMHGKGRIAVTVSEANGGCRVEFADAGPGIPPDIREKIFTPFFTTKARGSGLGLPTAKRIVEAHRGTIAIACPPSGGTVVTIELPTKPV